MSDTALDAIRAVPLFTGVSGKDLKAIAGMAKETTHPAGHAVVDEGGLPSGFHVIVAGSAEVTIGDSVVSTLGPGDYFGEISLIDGGRRTATVTAVTPLTTLAIPSWRFSALLDKSPELCRALLMGLCAAVRANAQLR